MKFLLVVDMQNDFITGTLANEDAQKIVPIIADYLKSWDGAIIFTRDTHDSDYLQTMEGKKLPIPHCLRDTEGWQINSDLIDSLNQDIKLPALCFNKPTFGYAHKLAELITDDLNTYPTSIEVVGTCTDICVVSNVLGLKEYFPEVPIKVHSNMCAGLTKEKHEAALEVMRSCQIEVI